MSASTSELERLRREAGADGGALRFKQGDSAPVDAFALVDRIHTLFGVSLVAPSNAELVWNDALGRRWACDCMEHVLPAAAAAVDDEDEVRKLRGAIHVARRYLDGDATRGRLDAEFMELFAEEWPTYEGPFYQLVLAAQQVTATDEGEVSAAGAGVVFAGKWVATSAREARRAAGDPAAEQRWQAARLLDYLLLGRGDGPVS
ncbi:MAG TPA: hypothetical protein VM261_24785 [Kofleriaceae bacterium]|nr:hypothetical protein [Kofleriaceae bacterium]